MICVKVNRLLKEVLFLSQNMTFQLCLIEPTFNKNKPIPLLSLVYLSNECFLFGFQMARLTRGHVENLKN